MLVEREYSEVGVGTSNDKDKEQQAHLLELSDPQVVPLELLLECRVLLSKNLHQVRVVSVLQRRAVRVLEGRGGEGREGEGRGRKGRGGRGGGEERGKEGKGREGKGEWEREKREESRHTSFSCLQTKITVTCLHVQHEDIPHNVDNQTNSQRPPTGLAYKHKLCQRQRAKQTEVCPSHATHGFTSHKPPPMTPMSNISGGRTEIRLGGLT